MADPLWKKKFEIINKHGVTKEILDIGCNVGDFSEMFIESGHVVSGADIDTENLGKARQKKICTIQTDLNYGINLPNESFETIFALEIVEHLSNSERVVKEAYRILKKDGKFYVSVPYFGFLKRILVSAFFFDLVFGYKQPHLRFFSEKMFKEMLEKNGFKIEKVYKLGRFFPFYMDMMVVCTK